MNRRNELGISNCDKCKKMNSQAVRQALGCGYEPPVDATTIWQPPTGKPKLTVCAGYTVHLPEVYETQLARAHWSTGNLACALGGETPTEDLLNAIVILEGANNDVQRWALSDEGREK